MHYFVRIFFLIFAVLYMSLIQHWINCLQFFIYNILFFKTFYRATLCVERAVLVPSFQLGTVTLIHAWQDVSVACRVSVCPRVACHHFATAIDWRHDSFAKWYGTPVISKYAALKWEYYGIVLTVYPAKSWAPGIRAHVFIEILSVRPSVCLSACLPVCPSVTLVDCVHMVWPTIMISSPYGSSIILVSGDIMIIPKFEGGHPERVRWMMVG